MQQVHVISGREDANVCKESIAGNILEVFDAAETRACMQCCALSSSINWCGVQFGKIAQGQEARTSNFMAGVCCGWKVGKRSMQMLHV